VNFRIPEPTPRLPEDGRARTGDEDTGRRQGPLHVYVSAARQDLRFLEALQGHLAPLSLAWPIELWHRSLDLDGSDPEGLAERRLARADLILLLVSPHSLGDDETQWEAERALALRAAHETPVLLILVRPCHWRLSRFDGSTVLPRSERALSSYFSLGSACEQVASGIAAAVQDLSAQRRTLRGAASAGDAPRMRAGTEPFLMDEDMDEDPFRGERGQSHALSDLTALVGVPIGVIFERTSAPRHLSVEPEQLRKIKNALRVPRRGLVLEGPAQSGRSTAVSLALDAVGMKGRFRWLRCTSEGDLDALDRVLASLDASAQVVIEHADRLSREAMAALAKRMEWLTGQDAADGKLVLLGLRGTARRLTEAERALAGRVDVIPMNRQPTARIQSLVDVAERVANLRFRHKAAIVAESLGSFRLAQELCFASAQTAKIDEVPRRAKPVLCDPREARAEVVGQLSVELREDLVTLARADAGTDAPGACLSLLWMLAGEESGSVSVAAAVARYPHLAPAFRWIESGALALLLGSDTNLGELFQLGPGALSTQDPRVLYYLRGLDWMALAAAAGIEAAICSGELQVTVRNSGPTGSPAASRAAARAGAPPETTSLLDAAPFRWARPEAVELRNLLASAYPTSADAEDLARTAGVTLRRWVKEGSIEQAWNSLLEIAAAQGELRALADRVLCDGEVKGYHAQLRRCVGDEPDASRAALGDAGEL
jgi:hypothetical protein